MQLISIDWGTSSFRASRWQIEQPAHGFKVIERLDSDKGLLSIHKAVEKSANLLAHNTAFETYLLETIGHWIDQPTTIVMSGMVGSKTGWLEAPYVKAPATIEQLAAQLIQVPLFAARLNTVHAYIIPGVSQATPPDVMRGEETQLFGLNEENCIDAPQDQTLLFILPGTHSKHVHFANGQLIAFKTFMTGELYGLLSQHGVLAALCSLNNFDQHSFKAGVLQAQYANELTAQLFSLRAKYLIENDGRFCTASALSGLLIGSEMKGVPHTTKVHLVGADALCDRYAKALELLDIKYSVEKNKSAELGALRIALKAKII
jgi:2-dehydro-3-deoxygalactonokinase